MRMGVPWVCRMEHTFLLLHSFADGRPLGLPDGTYFFTSSFFCGWASLGFAGWNILFYFFILLRMGVPWVCRMEHTFLLLHSFADGRPLGLPDGTYFFAVPDPAGLPLGLPVG